MLNSISISNFKAIQDELNSDGSTKLAKPLILDNLAKVNYLVGPNGCGKSSVLEAVHNFFILKDELKDKIWLQAKQGDLIEQSNNLSLPKTNGKWAEISSAPPFMNSQRLFIYTNFKGIVKLEIDEKSYELKINEIVQYNPIFEKNNSPIKPFLINCGLNNDYYNNDLIFTVLENKQKENYEIMTKKKFIEQKEIIRIKTFRFDMNDCVNFLINEFDVNNIVEKFYELKNKLGLKILDVLMDKRSSGENILENLICFILYFNDLYKNDIFLIEEPETNLHPTFQKLLPELFQNLSQELNIQFLISTHSPFIISAAAKEKDQKVYLIDKGHQVGLDYDIDWEELKKQEYFNNYIGQGQDGYEGYEVKEIANKMLGAKTTDILFENYVICEGEIDVVILNYIFQSTKNVKFISAGSKEQVDKKMSIGVILNKISVELDINGFVDWDGDDKQTKDFKEKWEKFGLKVRDTYPFRKIESFLYDKSVLEILKKDFPDIDLNLEIDDKKDKALDIFCTNSRDKKHTGHCEVWFSKNYINLGYDKFTNLNKQDFELKLAKIIRNMKNDESDLKNIYWQLHDCIFGELESKTISN